MTFSISGIAPAVAVGHQAEDDRADRAHRERERDRVSAMSGRVLPNARRDVVDDERQDEEVEGVERPAEKAGEDGVALVGALLFVIRAQTRRAWRPSMGSLGCT